MATPSAYAANVPVTISNGASNTKGSCSPTSCFNPQSVSINVGDTVTWTNSDTVGHTATSGNPSDNQSGTIFDSSLISSGKTYTSPAFNAAGTYNYFCQVHPWMTGQIIVGSSSPSPSAQYGQESISTDRSSYNYGDTITITGSGANLNTNGILTLIILNPNHQVVSGGGFTPGSGGQFVNSVSASGSLWSLSGMYTVALESNQNIIAQTTFNFISSQTFQTNPNPPSYPSTSGNNVIISNGASNTKGTCSQTSCFDPQVININVGNTVTWTNYDSVGHTATSGHPSDSQTGTVFDSSLISAGKSYTSPSFNVEGTYDYFCQVHPWMTGQIIVGSGSSQAPPQTQTPYTINVQTDRSAYNVGDTVTITTNSPGVPAGQNVAILVTDPLSNVVASRTTQFNAQGYATLQIGLQSNSPSGTYQVTASASSNGNYLKGSSSFTVSSNPAPTPQSSGVSIVSVQPTNQLGNNVVTSYSRGSTGFAKVVVSSTTSQSALITVNLVGSDGTSLGVGSIKTSLGTGTSEMIVSFYIPNGAIVGTANIYADMYSDWPNNGGTPLTAESSTTVGIQ